MTTAAETEAFWAFSLETYARPGVADACIALQDEHGFDVNLLLLCLWQADRDFRAFDKRATEDLRAAIGPWVEEVVVPLRTVRRQLKQPRSWRVETEDAEPCRRLVKGAELESDRVAQRLLIRMLASTPAARVGSARAAAQESFAAYAETLAASGAHAPLTGLIDLVFPDR